MNPIQLLIYTESFIVNKGLEFIFKRMRGVTVVAAVENLLDVDEYIKDRDIDFIIVSKSVFSEQSHLKELYKTVKNILWASIETNSVKINGFYSFEFELSVRDGEKETIRIINNYLTFLNESKEESQNESELSNREKEILKHVALGLTNMKIAERLFISQHTVITHRKKITSKLGIKTISGLTVYALLNNLIEINDVDELN